MGWHILGIVSIHQVVVDALSSVAKFQSISNNMAELDCSPHDTRNFALT